MTTEQQAELDKVVEDIRPLVKRIEDGPQLTKDHYGRYLPLIKSELHALIFIRAGANRAGVLAAMRVNGLPVPSPI